MNLSIIDVALRRGAGSTGPPPEPELTALADWDPSDLSTLYQDGAMTVPVTASGDPVGAVADKSGNGFHLTQSESARRPVYRTSGGLHWLEFDGSGQYLSRASFAVPDTISVGQAFEVLSTPHLNSFSYIFTGSGEKFARRAQVAGQFRGTFFNNGLSVASRSASEAPVDWIDGAPHVFADVLDASAGAVVQRVDGVQGWSKSGYTGLSVPDYTLLVGVNDFIAHPIEMNLYGMTVWADVAETQAAEAKLAARAGMAI